MSEQQPEATQPDPDSSSDNDRSWTDEPESGQDPDKDRSVDAVIEEQYGHLADDDT